MGELMQRIGRRHLEEMQASRAVATIPSDGGAVLTLPTASADTFCETMAKIQETGREFDGYFHDSHISRLRVTKRRSVPKSARPFCLAKTRAGTPCQARVCKKPTGVLAKRCRLHGGRSTGPTSEAGREAIRVSNRRRAKARSKTKQDFRASTCALFRSVYQGSHSALQVLVLIGYGALGVLPMLRVVSNIFFRPGILFRAARDISPMPDKYL